MIFFFFFTLSVNPDRGISKISKMVLTFLTGSWMVLTFLSRSGMASLHFPTPPQALHKSAMLSLKL